MPASEAALRESEEYLAAELRHATLLRDFAARLVMKGSETVIYQEILSAAVAITKSDAGTVQVYEPEGSSLALRSRFQRSDAASSTACGIALRTGQRTFVD